MTEFLSKLPSVSVWPHTPEDMELAQTLSVQWHLPFETDAPVLLIASQQGSWLRCVGPPELNWKIDFQSPPYQRLLAQRTRFNDPLSRAVGCHKKKGLRVLDMTAGLGKDAWWLSHCGAEVTLLERHPVLAFLLEEALKKAGSTMQVICADAFDYLSTLSSDAFDVAYYDPMFAPRTKTALVKKDMQILQALHGTETPDPALIACAQSLIPRVVVKRGKTDPILLEGVHHQLITQVTRLDVYEKSLAKKNPID